MQTMYAKFIEQDQRFAFSLTDNGGIEIDKTLHAELMSAQRTGKQIVPDKNGIPVAVEQPPPTEQDKIKAAESAVQAMLDAGAKAQGYDGILSAASYAALPVGEPFQAEGAAFLLWRAKCWAHCYAVMADVKAVKRPEPTPTELVGEMPALLLP